MILEIARPAPRERSTAGNRTTVTDLLPLVDGVRLSHRSAVSTRKGGGFYGYKSTPPPVQATGLPVE